MLPAAGFLAGRVALTAVTAAPLAAAGSPVTYHGTGVQTKPRTATRCRAAGGLREAPQVAAKAVGSGTDARAGGLVAAMPVAAYTAARPIHSRKRHIMRTAIAVGLLCVVPASVQADEPEPRSCEVKCRYHATAREAGKSDATYLLAAVRVVAGTPGEHIRADGNEHDFRFWTQVAAVRSTTGKLKVLLEVDLGTKLKLKSGHVAVLGTPFRIPLTWRQEDGEMLDWLEVTVHELKD